LPNEVAAATEAEGDFMAAEGSTPAEVEGSTVGLEVSVAGVGSSGAVEGSGAVEDTVAAGAMDTPEAAPTAAMVDGGITVGAGAIADGAADMVAIPGTDGGSVLDGRMGGGIRMGTATTPGGIIPTLTITATRIPVLRVTHALTTVTMILHRWIPAQGRTRNVPRDQGELLKPKGLVAGPMWRGQSLTLRNVVRFSPLTG